MRIAVFSDIHGNPYACRAVLRAIELDGSFDQVIAAGDLSLGGSDPAGCIDLIRQAGARAVYGNTDHYLFAPEVPPGDELHLKKWDEILADVRWALPRLGKDRLTWLAELPFQISISADQSPAQDLLVVHANPKDIELMILPPQEEQPGLFGGIRQPDDDAHLLAALDGVPQQTIAFGHLHYTSERRLGSRRLINVAPASLPAYSPDDPRARYTVFTWAEDGWDVQRRYVDYDFRLEVDALLGSSMPGASYYRQSYPDV